MQIILFLGLVLWSWSCKTQPDKTNEAQKEEAVVSVISEVLTPEKFQSKMEEVGTMQLVDVRTPEEFKDGTIPGSQNINVLADDFAEKVKNLDKDKPVLVYCRRGGRSSRAAKTLKSLGFTEIYDLDGGITSWKSKDLPTQPPSN